MTAARRWWCVALGVLLLVATPALVRALPVGDDGDPATAVLARVHASRVTAFRGFVETDGNLALPDNDALSSLSTLLGEPSRVRVWWAGPDRYRTSVLRTTGETDLLHRDDRTVRWVYESKRVTVVPDVPVRLPDTPDLLPNELARHVLQGARPSQLRRLPAERVAGRTALGLRLTPGDPVAGVGRVDLYADEETGVPLSVTVYARGSRLPALTTRFVDFSVGAPAPAALAFTPPADARVRFDGVVDLASAADRFASRTPPRTLAGLPARGRTVGSVGVYGRGPTVLLAIPLWSRSADRVREELTGQPGVASLPQGLLVAAPPVRLLLGGAEASGASWLLVGTLTQAGMLGAAQELADHPPGLGGSR